ncbi:YaiI/YqxD family protein [Aestuariibacter sp. AA17]|uniref:UPF0178 protein OE749_11760 n=1 Tax=Fluctibacter corallii TaxID=2984329 RepID=A0ABT3A9L7_9ALTE|nr:YaiI/YqxD family protein [Aestuariibacter sp. AA17]MCV2885370.1 YaiI/YqxD family protein [Aestuariibacter sp. AA17]
MSQFTVWVDADGCPNIIKEVLFKAAQRTGVQLTLVANHYVKVPPAKNIAFLQVEQGFDVADNELVQRIESGDMLITSDLPLASDAIAKQVSVINFRGEALTKENIGSRLNMRDFLDTIRSSGVHTGGPPPLGQSDKQTFANTFDRVLTQKLNS